MSRSQVAIRRWVAVGVVISALGLLGCSTATPNGESPTSSRPTPTKEPQTATTAPEVRQPGGEMLADCETARQEPINPPADDDLTIGALTYRGLANGYPTVDGQPASLDADGQAFYKIGTALTDVAEVTVSIGAEARDYAGIVVEGGWGAGYSQVTYRSCADLPAGASDVWVGGFVLHGRTSACLPIDVTLPGADVRRIDVAFPAGLCD